MPRCKPKLAESSVAVDVVKEQKGKNKNTKPAIHEMSNENDNKLVKEELDSPPGGSGGLNLSQFKFEKRPHIKIAFENDPPVKEPKLPGLWEPPHWRDFLLNLRNMRSNNDAPVDSMGCHMSMDLDAAPEVIRYQSLVSLMLSSQTKDQVTFAAMKRLRVRGLTVENVLKMSDEELGQLIYPVGFWKTKIKYIKKTTEILKEQYNGDIPDSVEKLCKLPGVGPKMAHICMKVAWNRVTGIGVDTHVHRISNRIGWVKKPTSTPEDTRKALETWLPFDLWSEVNHLMVGFGQTICLPIGPMCYECLNNDICPSRDLARKTPKKTPKKSPVKEEKNQVLGLLDVKKELDLDKSPRKKVTRKQKQQVVKQDNNRAFQNDEATSKKANFVEDIQGKQKIKDEEMDNFEDKKIHLPVKAEKKKASPKRKITKKEQNIQDGDLGKVYDTVEAKKDSPKKRRVTPKKQAQADESQNTFSTKSNQNKRNAKPEVKRKSPKNKTK
ncbi:endonuclease III homolog isoform X2 [Hyposmocoma kahamanoa]|uniref:endonuclease III homolog isoform X2 n=1 Tax=Hyposmocoma kahamanoa TaxID=1477025 RepID=UPI000E6D8112|nr:endonuclease III homolog isoform X2 [Hyposmocoma kahamanoa]